MNPSRFWRAAEFACKSARSIIRGHGAPVLPGPLDDGDLLAAAEEEHEVLDETVPWWVVRAVEAKAAAAVKRLEKPDMACGSPVCDIPCSPACEPKTPAVSATAAVGRTPPLDDSPSSSGADSMVRCRFCQQPIKQLEDGLWFHLGRNLLRCTDIPDFPMTYATPERR